MAVIRLSKHLALGLLLSCASFASPKILARSPDCSSFLSLLGEITGILRALTALEAGEGSSLVRVSGPETEPDILHRVVSIGKQVQPHVDFLRFSDSDLLLAVTVAQLKSLGINELPSAQSFLRSFTELSADQQQAFIGGLLFRSLSETQNKFSHSENAARLGVDQKTFSENASYLSGIGPEELPGLTLLLTLHFALRSEAFLERLEASWDGISTYSSPFPKDQEPWIKAHGVTIDPNSGAQLYTGPDSVTLLTALSAIGSTRAARFFLELASPNLSQVDLRSISNIASLDKTTRHRAEELIGERTGELLPATPPEKRQRLVNQTEAELRLVTAQVQLLTWAKRIGESGLGDLSQHIPTIAANIETQVTSITNSIETTTTAWLVMGMRAILNYVGITDSNLPTVLTKLITGILGSSVARPIQDYSSAAATLAAHISPILDLAQSVRSGAPQGDLQLLLDRQAELNKRLSNLGIPGTVP